MSKTDLTSPGIDRKAVYADLDKQIGKGVGRMMQDMAFEPIERVSTGTLVGDYVTGGGIPCGRITEFYGPPSGGKTALALRVLCSLQQAGEGVAYIDAEHQWDPEWATVLGLNVDDVFVLQPRSAEEAVRGMLIYLKHGIKGVVLDSIPAMRTEAELKGDVAEAKVGAGPRLWSMAVPRLQTLASEHQSVVLLLNQVRAAIGATMQTETTAGGYALKHAYTLRLEVRRAEAIREKHGDEAEEVGYRARLKVTKNRGPSGRRGFTPFYYGEGFRPSAELVALGEEYDVVKKSGAWYSYNGERMGQGKVQAQAWLESHPEQAAEVRTAILRHLNKDEETGNDDDAVDVAD